MPLGLPRNAPGVHFPQSRAVTRPDRQTREGRFFAPRGLSPGEGPQRRRTCSPRSQRLRYIGLDLHKQSLEACAPDERGKRLFRQAVACRREALEQFAKEHLRPTDKVALEATTNTGAVVAILRPYVAAVVV